MSEPYRTSTSPDPRGTAQDPMREVRSRETIDGQRYDVLSCGHRYYASATARVTDGRLLRRCPHCLG